MNKSIFMAFFVISAFTALNASSFFKEIRCRVALQDIRASIGDEGIANCLILGFMKDPKGFCEERDEIAKRSFEKLRRVVDDVDRKRWDCGTGTYYFLPNAFWGRSEAESAEYYEEAKRKASDAQEQSKINTKIAILTHMAYEQCEFKYKK